MKVIEEKIYKAIQRRENFATSPMSGSQASSYYNSMGYIGHRRDVVEMTEKGFTVKLWGNTIAELKGDILKLSDCGWAGNTTASRLNTVIKALDLPICYRWGQGGYFLDKNSQKVDSTTIRVDITNGNIVGA